MVEKYKEQLEELTKEKITFKNRHWQSQPVSIIDLKKVKIR